MAIGAKCQHISCGGGSSGDMFWARHIATGNLGVSSSINRNAGGSVRGIVPRAGGEMAMFLIGRL